MQHQRQATFCSIYGTAVSLRNSVPGLRASLRRSTQPFICNEVPQIAGVTPTQPIEGTIRPYIASEVTRCLSQSATRLPDTRDGQEIYQDGERFWLIDDRWGLTEINLLKGRWRSWVLPDATLDVDHIVEAILHWPLAQLLRSRGIYLLPCTSLTRGESGTLIFSPLNITAEVVTLIRAGYRVVGQRWTAVREEEGRLTMLHLPARSERTQRRAWQQPTQPQTVESRWIDLEAQFTGCSSGRANVDRVILIEAGRRPTGNLHRLVDGAALAAIRCAWPIAELHPQRANAQLPNKLARKCQVFSVRLTPRPADLIHMIDGLRRSEFADAVQTLAIHETTRQLEKQIAKIVFEPQRLAG